MALRFLSLGSLPTFVRGVFIASLLAVPFTYLSAADPANRRPGASASNSAGSAHQKFSSGFKSLFSLAGTNSRSSSNLRQQVISGLPLNRLTDQARNKILSVAKSPTIFRRLPPQQINCDRDMFLFLSRNPEVLVGMWDLMGITNIDIKRIGPYQLEAEDGSGTHCVVDLVYGDANQHIFVANGSYDGRMVAKPIRGRGVFVLRSHYATAPNGDTVISGTLDCFVKFDSLGADLVARTLSGLIGRSADNNFAETARFMSQVSQASENNPPAMLDVADRLPQVPASTKVQFANAITTVARRGVQLRAARESANRIR